MVKMELDDGSCRGEWRRLVGEKAWAAWALMKIPREEQCDVKENLPGERWIEDRRMKREISIQAAHTGKHEGENSRNKNVFSMLRKASGKEINDLELSGSKR